jgi:holo-[acyl-carrier protein] synthase
MIYGIGTDIVSVARIRDGLERFGEKFARKILTERELSDYLNAADPEHFLARRFAAKEATAKAMGTGFVSGLGLHHIGVGHDRNGKPMIEYEGRGEDLKNELGIGESYISIADEKDHAVAFVTLMLRDV